MPAVANPAIGGDEIDFTKTGIVKVEMQQAQSPVQQPECRGVCSLDTLA